ncbi:XRE family transcriptional regulator [Flaviaesturariibacter flavus]|uniref:XRE family transcriptional regulator n=1 Tax=Flaviaesturariibacter flavus TaxID=2502780 RepID=UPI0014042E98|nr:helix-turn-helix transcriptional regulator [Flaviaesturariibacter flavus]
MKHLRKRSAKTQEQLGQDIRLGRTTIANYEAGFSSPTDPEVLIRLSHVFGVSIDELLTRDLSQAFSNAAPNRTAAAAPPPSPLTDFVRRRQVLYETTLKLHHSMGTPNVIVVDSQGEEKIVFVPKEEAVLYSERRKESAWLGSLPLYALPGLQPETHRMFEVADGAMSPRFTPGDRIVCRWLAGLDDLRDGHAYLVVTQAGLWLRRVLNRLPEQGGLQLVADDPTAVPPSAPTNVRREDLLELWSVEWVISANLAPPMSQVYGRIADLEQQLRNLNSRLNDRP